MKGKYCIFHMEKQLENNVKIIDFPSIFHSFSAAEKGTLPPVQLAKPGPVTMSDGHEEFYVERILLDKLHYGRRWYKVHYYGYGPEEDEWVRDTELADSPLLEAYLAGESQDGILLDYLANLENNSTPAPSQSNAPTPSPAPEPTSAPTPSSSSLPQVPVRPPNVRWLPPRGPNHDSPSIGQCPCQYRDSRACLGGSIKTLPSGCETGGIGLTSRLYVL